MTIVHDALEAKQNDEYRKALSELLFQLADDDFITAYRGSEWLGLAPHIEEDIAYSSINQDTMGHAAIYYQLLEQLGFGPADALAHSRPVHERKNAIILEEVNGPGTYLEEPRYDWAFTVVRNYFYDLYKKIKLESLKNSSYEPLAQAAVKINMEQYYHLMHWETWFRQLTLSGGEAKTRMVRAIEKVWEDFEGVLTFGAVGGELAKHGLIEGEELLKKRFYSKIKLIFEQVQLPEPAPSGMKSGNGRNGEHTEDLKSALEVLSEVYRSDPSAVW
ncbi:1,2-phenylacetyl-CoA epoxidase subunit PaaC [Metabacillus sp. FJAT-52054]|uniref:1,2-phenylacetyl-CoA epoxidase subunit PaaC n=1 Tax=Metabacillus sediminis TaxID=3117746 RepID=A0ABZ2NJC2_9BACI